MPNPLTDGAHINISLDSDQLHGVWDWMHGNGPRTADVDTFLGYLQGLRQGRHSAVTIGLGASPDDLSGTPVD